MDRLLKFAALVEFFTGVALITIPSPVALLLLGVELDGVSPVLARVAGIAMMSLGIACWPGSAPTRSVSTGLLIYNLFITIFLAYLGIQGEWVGYLLWPVVGLHAVLTILFMRVRFWN